MTIFSLRQLPETGVKTRLKAGIKSALLAGMMVAGTIAPAAATDKITLLLDWFVNPDHGPIIIAEEKGYFKDAGLEVEVIAPADPADPAASKFGCVVRP